jgi:hypothetical protein
MESELKITYDTYQNTEGDKTDWCVHVRENGNSRLVFFGATKPDAMSKATAWANANLDTLERREILRQRADAARERRAKAKAKEAA